MSLGASLALIAVGAILRYAVTWRSSDIDIPVVGLILMIVGIVGFVIALLYELVVARERSRYYRSWGRDRYDAPPADPNAPTRRYHE